MRDSRFVNYEFQMFTTLLPESVVAEKLKLKLIIEFKRQLKLIC